MRGQWKPCPEKPERATALKEALLAAGHQVAVPQAGDRTAIAAVHGKLFVHADDALLMAGLQSWAALFGAISFTLFGQFHNVVGDLDALFDGFNQQLATNMMGGRRS